MTANSKKQSSSTIPHVKSLQSVTETLYTEQHTKGGRTPKVRMRIGQVVSVTGDRVLIMIDLAEEDVRKYAPRLGGMVCIEAGSTDLVATVAGLSSPSPGMEMESNQLLLAELELLGMFHTLEDGRKVVRRGVKIFPALGDLAAAMTMEDQQALYGAVEQAMMEVGQVTNVNDIPAMLDPDKLLASNFAVLGMPGSGKSCAATVITRAFVKHHHPVRTIIIDQHNEYGKSFGRAAHITRFAENIISYWMLSFKELVYLLEAHGGRLSKQEMEVLAVGICAVRKRYLQMHPEYSTARTAGNVISVSVDTPVPYRLTDLVGYIDASLKSDSVRANEGFRQIRTRIDLISRDPQYQPVFGNTSTQDTLSRVISSIFRMPLEGKPISVLQLGGLLPQVAEVIVSMVARYAQVVVGHNNGQTPVLLLLEDAHHFVPEDTSKAPISSEVLMRIFEKSTKLAVSIGLISARPREISQMVLEQCKTLLPMRMTNRSDKEFLFDIAPESAAGLLSGIGVLGRSEAIAIGTGTRLPMRLQFSSLPREAVPMEIANASANATAGQPPMDQSSREYVEQVIGNWRFNNTGSA
jgi:hypothetical protein